MDLKDAIKELEGRQKDLPSSCRLLQKELVELAVELMKADALQKISGALHGINMTFNGKLFTRNSFTGVDYISVKLEK